MKLARLVIALLALALNAMLVMQSSAYAQGSNDCGVVRIGTVGWLDAGAVAATASALLSGLGYKVSLKKLSTPVIFASLKNHNLDVTLEIMIPTMGNDIKPYILDNSIELINKNLSGTKYSLAANSAATKLGLTSFEHIAAHGEALGYTIHGPEAGADGSLLIQNMISENRFGLGKFRFQAGSEDDLLARVSLSVRQDRPLVFLAWEPHSMNIRFDLHYLTDGDEVFGAKFGGADVYTGMRSSLVGACPNIEQLFKNLSFTLPMVNEIMTAILEFKASPLVAAVAWIRQQPEVLNTWLEDVTTVDQKPGIDAVQRFIGLTGE